MRGIRGTLARPRSAPEPAVLRVVVVAIAAVQAGVLGLLARRGSWLSDDLDFLVQGGRGFAPAELLTPLNDHIAPGLRFTYATFAAVAPLNWDFTVAWRVLLQALAIALFGLLLLRLLKASWWVPAGTLLYALTALSMPSFMSLSSSVNNLPAHVFGLLLLHATLDWYAGHRIRAVAYGPVSLLISLACWEKSGLILVTSLASALYLRELPIRAWLRQTLPYAAALVAPVIAFGIVYATHGQPTRGDLPAAGKLLQLTARSFAVPVGALAGGPWSWSPIAGAFGTANAPVAALVLGGVVAGALLLTAWRHDRRALLLWASVGIYTLATLLLIAYGRYEVFGDVFTVHYHYWSDLSIPLILAVVLTARSVRLPIGQARFAPVVPVAGLCALLAWTAGSVVSTAGFAQYWDDNPSRSYFATLRAELDKAGPSVNLWDTRLPGSLSSILVKDARLSPVLRTAGIPFQLQASTSEPRLVDDSGKIHPAQLKVWAEAVIPPKGSKLCALHLEGVNTVTLPLRLRTPQVPPAAWFVKFSYLAGRQNTVELELVGTNGRAVQVPVPPGAAVAGFANMYLGPTPVTDLAAVRLRTTALDSSLCVGSVEIGLPQVSE